MEELKELQKAYDEFIKSADEIIEKAKKKEKQSKVWKPEKGEEYFIIDTNGKTIEEQWIDHEMDGDCYRVGNCFKTEEEAEEVAEKLEIYTELKRLAEELNEESIDWEDCKQKKWYIACNRQNDALESGYRARFCDIGQIYCTNPNFLDIAKDRIGEERLLELFS